MSYTTQPNLEPNSKSSVHTAEVSDGGATRAPQAENFGFESFYKVRNRLLDLTRSNRLINFTSERMVRFIDVSLEEIYNKFTAAGKVIHLQGISAVTFGQFAKYLEWLDADAQRLAVYGIQRNPHTGELEFDWEDFTPVKAEFLTKVTPVAQRADRRYAREFGKHSIHKTEEELAVQALLDAQEAAQEAALEAAQAGIVNADVAHATSHVASVAEQVASSDVAPVWGAEKTHASAQADGVTRVSVTLQVPSSDVAVANNVNSLDTDNRESGEQLAELVADETEDLSVAQVEEALAELLGDEFDPGYFDSDDEDYEEELGAGIKLTVSRNTSENSLVRFAEGYEVTPLLALRLILTNHEAREVYFKQREMNALIAQSMRAQLHLLSYAEFLYGVGTNELSPYCGYAGLSYLENLHQASELGLESAVSGGEANPSIVGVTGADTNGIPSTGTEEGLGASGVMGVQGAGIPCGMMNSSRAALDACGQLYNPLVVQEASTFDSKSTRQKLQALDWDDNLNTYTLSAYLSAHNKSIREMGAGILYLSLGILEFGVSEQNADFAPLYLIPVSIANSKRGTSEYSISYTGEDIIENVSLHEKLYREQHVYLPRMNVRANLEQELRKAQEQIPLAGQVRAVLQANVVSEAELDATQLAWANVPVVQACASVASIKAALSKTDADAEYSVGEYLALVRASLLTQGMKFAIHAQAYLGMFKFAKQRMYLDLDPENWNQEVQIEEHPIIRQLFNPEGATTAAQTQAQQDYDIDNLERVHERYPLVNEADSSQHSALIDVIDGKNMVIEGPPGSGKSQTITNIIVAALAQGKKVLFVSEKMAALEVVYRRIQEMGLGDFCLEMHDPNSLKRYVVDSLEHRMRTYHQYQPAYDFQQCVATYETLKTELNNYAQTINALFANSGFTNQEILAGAAYHRKYNLAHGGLGLLDHQRIDPETFFTRANYKLVCLELESFATVINRVKSSLVAQQRYLKRNLQSHTLATMLQGGASVTATGGSEAAYYASLADSKLDLIGTQATHQLETGFSFGGTGSLTSAANLEVVADTSWAHPQAQTGVTRVNPYLEEGEGESEDNSDRVGAGAAHGADMDGAVAVGSAAQDIPARLNIQQDGSIHISGSVPVASTSSLGQGESSSVAGCVHENVASTAQANATTSVVAGATGATTASASATGASSTASEADIVVDATKLSLNDHLWYGVTNYKLSGVEAGKVIAELYRWQANLLEIKNFLHHLMVQTSQQLAQTQVGSEGSVGTRSNVNAASAGVSGTTRTDGSIGVTGGAGTTSSYEAANSESTAYYQQQAKLYLQQQTFKYNPLAQLDLFSLEMFAQKFSEIKLDAGKAFVDLQLLQQLLDNPQAPNSAFATLQADLVYLDRNLRINLHSQHLFNFAYLEAVMHNGAGKTSDSVAPGVGVGADASTGLGIGGGVGSGVRGIEKSGQELNAVVVGAEASQMNAEVASAVTLKDFAKLSYASQHKLQAYSFARRQEILASQGVAQLFGQLLKSWGFVKQHVLDYGSLASLQALQRELQLLHDRLQENQRSAQAFVELICTKLTTDLDLHYQDLVQLVELVQELPAHLIKYRNRCYASVAARSHYDDLNRELREVNQLYLSLSGTFELGFINDYKEFMWMRKTLLNKPSFFARFFDKDYRSAVKLRNAVFRGVNYDQVSQERALQEMDNYYHQVVKITNARVYSDSFVGAFDGLNTDLNALDKLITWNENLATFCREHLHNSMLAPVLQFLLTEDEFLALVDIGTQIVSDFQRVVEAGQKVNKYLTTDLFNFMPLEFVQQCLPAVQVLCKLLSKDLDVQDVDLELLLKDLQEYHYEQLQQPAHAGRATGFVLGASATNPLGAWNPSQGTHGSNATLAGAGLAGSSVGVAGFDTWASLGGELGAEAAQAQLMSLAGGFLSPFMTNLVAEQASTYGLTLGEMYQLLGQRGGDATGAAALSYATGGAGVGMGSSSSAGASVGTGVEAGVGVRSPARGAGAGTGLHLATTIAQMERLFNEKPLIAKLIVNYYLAQQLIELARTLPQVSQLTSDLQPSEGMREQAQALFYATNLGVGFDQVLRYARLAPESKLSINAAGLSLLQMFASFKNYDSFVLWQGQLQHLHAHILQARTAFTSFASLTQLDEKLWLGKGTSSLFDLLVRNQLALECADGLVQWLDYLGATIRLQELGISKISSLAEQLANVDASVLTTMFSQIFFNYLATRVVNGNPLLKNFSSLNHNALIHKFDLADQALKYAQRRHAAYVIDSRAYAREGFGGARAADFTEMQLLSYWVEHKTMRATLRDIFFRAGKSIQELKPCFMMSPASVAQYLIPGQLQFDLLVMDEASQVTPEDALGAIARCQQMVVVGDPKQLPPTNFFATKASDEDEREMTVTEQSKSILDVAKTMFPTRVLRWHYRSRHQSLIRFSNQEYYNGQLVVFPSPYKDHPEFGVKFTYVQGNFHYKRGNVPEAQVVAQAIARHLKNSPHESLGVVTMNVKQSKLISKELERLALADAELLQALATNHQSLEPLFIQNLENVQGDERDVIFISFTYGPAKVGDTNVPQRFGPINRQEGSNRLNVLFTRSKKRMEVFSSMRYTDIQVTAKQNASGVPDLRRFLKYAETGILEQDQQQSYAAELLTSPELEHDYIVSYLQTSLASKYDIESHIGISGYRLDLAFAQPQSHTYILGLETDGRAYAQAQSARDRDRLRAMVLRRLGWHLERMWTMDWYKYSNQEITAGLEQMLASLAQQQGAVAVTEVEQREQAMPAQSVQEA